MAQNYLQFSFQIEDLTDDDRLILQTLWDLQCETDPLWDAEITNEAGNADLPEGWEKHFTKDEINEYWGMLGGSVEDDRPVDLCGVEFSFDDDGEETEPADAGHVLWIRAEESADPGAVVELLQVWLKKTGSDRVIEFQWAEYCDRLRVDEFGGGGVAFTATEKFFVNVSKQLSEWVEAHSKK